MDHYICTRGDRDYPLMEVSYCLYSLYYISEIGISIENYMLCCSQF